MEKKNAEPVKYHHPLHFLATIQNEPAELNPCIAWSQGTSALSGKYYYYIN